MNIKNIKQFDENSGYYTELSNKLDKLQSAHDEKESIAKQKFEDSIKLDKEALKSLEVALLDYADTHQDELFTTSKSYKNSHITVSKRSSQSLELATGFTTDKVIENIKSKFQSLIARFIVSKESIDKTAIKALLKSKELDEAKLKAIGFVNDEKETLSLKINR